MPRLVITVGAGKSFMVDDDVQITIQEAEGGRASVMIDAPRHRKVLRTELWLRDQARKQRKGPAAAEAVG